MSQDKIESYDSPKKEIEPMKESPSIEIKNLIVSSMPKEEFAIGTPADVAALAKTRSDLKAIVWSEQQISLVLHDRSTSIVFQPEIDPTVQMFFTREERRHFEDIFSPGQTVWEGDFKPVRFTKRNLLKLIKEYEADVPDEVKEALKSLRVTQTQKSDSQLISVEDDSERTVEEESTRTNLPRQFTLNMPLAYGVRANLEFEARVVRDSYDRGKTTIELRCMNARKVLQDLMQGVLEQLPPDVPKYYGIYNPRHKER